MRAHNWSDTHTFTAPIHRPASTEDVRRLVAGAARVHAVGARHSFNAVADSPGILLDLTAIPPEIVIDRERRMVTVSAATSYGMLARHLHAAGWALHNLASLPHVSVAGATATGTHGSGDRNGTLSSAVAALERVNAAGDLVTIRRGEPGFDAMVVGLGAFGVVTRVTLDIQPTFDLRQDAFVALPWDAVLAHFETIMSCAYSVSLLTFWSRPSIDRLWLKTHLSDGTAHVFDATRLGATAAPSSMPSGREDPGNGLNPFGGIPGPWSERLAHFRLEAEPGVLDQIQSEYMLPRANAPAAFGALRAMGERIDPLLHATEIRSMAADDLWLSPSYGHDAVAIHFTWKKQREAIAAISREVEDLLIPFGGRPHWGKLMHAPAARLAPLYPRFAEFRDLARAEDPSGKFRNAFLDRHVFGGSEGQAAPELALAESAADEDGGDRHRPG